MSYLKKRLRSFGFAIAGIIAFVRSEPHALLHFIATIIVVGAGFYFRITNMQWIAILIMIGIVWITEMINTVLEKVMDHVAPDYHPRVKWIKDVAAGAVLIAAIIAIIVGALIFIPYF
ncbi:MULTISPECIES: diacylglycerol kinase family protein [Chitinophaga]|uniref:diacylglycerol kinase family protein n=1 Tax=Chitinophaga TaxID=79328 RepID=UPI0009C8CA21|nr:MULTISPECIES: diacylglycerol kinase family protein [Chitinophaga]OMP79464.1 diacylglycerol kinase [[Flexibacter] sp. ATCC 35208]WPQ63937.1 diacylglycerol kinase family protein [Chitinophaga sancti]WPV68383.1 diacylglycerol kinase family protein [Chitinophaga sp. LS1]